MLIRSLIMITFFSFSTTHIWANDNLKTEKQKSSYVIGRNIGENLSKQDEEIDLKSLNEGLKDSLNKKPSKISEAESQKIRENFFSKIREKQMKKITKIKEDSEKYLVENAKKKNVQSLKSGLQYIVEKEGDGPKPKASDTVMVKYIGKFINGSIFDQSKRNDTDKPAELNLSQVIKGWQEGIPLMKVGSKYKFFVPYKLGYGERGAQTIPPYSTLIFDVELVGIKK